MKWQELASTSHFQTAEAIKRELMAGHVDEATTGIEELIEALGRSERRALRSQLTRLMMHIIKWKIQPRQRSRSWMVTIENARVEIEEILEEEPSQKQNISELWNKCFQSAKRLAHQETGILPQLEDLSRTEVFEKEYILKE